MPTGSSGAPWDTISNVEAAQLRGSSIESAVAVKEGRTLGYGVSGVSRVSATWAPLATTVAAAARDDCPFYIGQPNPASWSWSLELRNFTSKGQQDLSLKSAPAPPFAGFNV